MRSALKLIVVGSIFALVAAQAPETCSRACKIDCHSTKGSFEECAHQCGCPAFEQGLLKFIAETPKYCNEFCDRECGAPSALNLVCNESCNKKCTDIYVPSKSQRVVLHSKVLSAKSSDDNIDLLPSLKYSIE
jgi:hypothetical protein